MLFYDSKYVKNTPSDFTGILLRLTPKKVMGKITKFKQNAQNMA